MLEHQTALRLVYVLGAMLLIGVPTVAGLQFMWPIADSLRSRIALGLLTAIVLLIGAYRVYWYVAYGI